jgi:chaperonin GroEL (HSP60 family)
METNSPISTSDTRETLVKDVNQLKQDATRIAQDVKAHANAHVDETKRRLNDALNAVQARLAERPLLLLGVGFVLGYVFAGRRRRRA